MSTLSLSLLSLCFHRRPWGGGYSDIAANHRYRKNKSVDDVRRNVKTDEDVSIAGRISKTIEFSTARAVWFCIRNNPAAAAAKSTAMLLVVEEVTVVLVMMSS